MFLTIIFILFIILKIYSGQGDHVIPISLSSVLTLIGLDIIIHRLFSKKK